MVVFSVLYPAKDGAKFDKDYYAATHVPLLKDAFAATGLKDAQVLWGQPGPDGSPAPYVVIINLFFDGPEAMMSSLGGPRAPEVLSDVVNFTDITPITQVSALG